MAPDHRDAGTITLKAGQLKFLPPVMNRRTAAVFTGEGVLRLTPAIPIEEEQLKNSLGTGFRSESPQKTEAGAAECQS